MGSQRVLEGVRFARLDCSLTAARLQLAVAQPAPQVAPAALPSIAFYLSVFLAAGLCLGVRSLGEVVEKRWGRRLDVDLSGRTEEALGKERDLENCMDQAFSNTERNMCKSKYGGAKTPFGF